MKRRPHWDTELEGAVSAILFDCYGNGVSEEQVYQVIAAVEDWVLSAPIFDLYLSRKHAPDKAAIARVRELHAPHDDCPDGYAMCAGRGMCYACGTHWPCATIRILNGGDA